MGRPFGLILEEWDDEGQTRLLVVGFEQGGSGSRAGIQIGDVITHIESQPVKTLADLQSIEQEHVKDEPMRVEYVHGSDRMETSIRY